MRKITYYVATSLDGFIAGPGEDISGFVHSGNGVDQYLQDLQSYDTVIMGRKTYEFGYAFGLQPGQPAYPHMQHYIFSDTLKFDKPHERVKVCSLDLEIIRQLKEGEGTDIYLCGGGVFAGWLLDNELIDTLKIKLNPLVLGQGVRLFGDSKKTCRLAVSGQEQYDGGLQIITYRIDYS
ncbi:MAG: dihydrofolate reductase [Phaeodactylibacter sp.]|nr:dihydrofolate reductase [Phaeodactylibacter sp.]